MDDQTIDTHDHTSLEDNRAETPSLPPALTASRRAFLGQAAVLGGAFFLGGWDLLAEAAVEKGQTPAQLLADADLILDEGFERGLAHLSAPKLQLAAGAAQPHSGKNCLKAAMLQPQQGLQLDLPIKLDADSLYHMEVWMRSDSGDCAATVLLMKTFADRTEVTRMENIPTEWTKFEVVFRQAAPSQDKLGFYLPNTWLGQPGTVWIDDIKVRRIAACRARSVSAGPGLEPNYAQDCALARTGEDAAQLLWLAHIPGAPHVLNPEQKALFEKGALGLDHAPGADRILTRPYAASHWGKPETLAEGLLFHPAIAANAIGELCAAWSQKDDDGRWSINYRLHPAANPQQKAQDKNWSKPLTLKTQDSAWRPTLAADRAGRFWAAFVGNAGGPCRIYFSSLSPDGPGEPFALSPENVNAYDPSIAHDSSGALWIAWHQFAAEGYRIFTRHAQYPLQSEKYNTGWSDPLAVTPIGLDAAHVTLTPDPVKGGGMWLAYDAGMIRKGKAAYHQHAVAQRMKIHMELAHVRADAIRALYPPYGSWPQNEAGELGRILFDPQGRMTLIERAYNRHDDRHWDLSLRHATGGKTWSLPTFISGAKHGYGFAPAAVALMSGILVAYQTDTRGGDRHGDLEDGASELLAEMIPSPPKDSKDSPATPGQIVTVFPREPRDTANKAFLDDGERFFIEYEDRKLYVFWGETHIHSRLSTCAGNRDLDPFDAYSYNRDYQGLDFMALTDHGGHINSIDWFNTRKLASLQNNPPHFVAFSAQEWSSARVGEMHGTGHKNVFYLADNYQRFYNPFFSMTPDELWKELSDCGHDVFTIPHQIADASGGAWTDWHYHNEKFQPVAEIFQIRGSFEHLNCPWMSDLAQKKKGSFYQDALELGHRLGVVASSDHGGGHGKAAVFAEKLDREPIFRAIQARRCYGSTNARILLDLRVNGRLMGEAIKTEAGRPRQIAIRVLARVPLKQVVIFKNGQIIQEKTAPLGHECKFEFEDSKAEKPTDYYYLRAIQTNDQIAWSSPVWVS